MTTAAGIAPFPSDNEDEKKIYPANEGDLFLVKSYFPNFLESSLRGPIGDVGERFNGAINAPTRFLGKITCAVAKKEGIVLNSGLYVPRPGPNYETPLEVSILGLLLNKYNIPVLGGMSVTPELEAANMLKMHSLVLSIGTNNMFDLDSLDNLEEELDLLIGKEILDNQGEAKCTLDEAEGLLWDTFEANQPKHDEVKEIAESEGVTENLEKLIGGVVKAIKF